MDYNTHNERTGTRKLASPKVIGDRGHREKSSLAMHVCAEPTLADSRFPETFAKARHREELFLALAILAWFLYSLITALKHCFQVRALFSLMLSDRFNSRRDCPPQQGIYHRAQYGSTDTHLDGGGEQRAGTGWLHLQAAFKARKDTVTNPMSGLYRHDSHTQAVRLAM